MKKILLIILVTILIVSCDKSNDNLKIGFWNVENLFDLENNLNEYGYFSVRGVGETSDPTLAVIMRFDNSNTDYVNELSVIKWRSGTTNASMYKYVKLKAVLWTTNSGVTPILESYRLKLGV